MSTPTIAGYTQRHVSPYSTKEKVGRMAWSFVQASVFRCSWPTWYEYRAWLLRRFRAKIGPNCRVRRTARIACPWNLAMGPESSIGESTRLYCLGQVTIGRRVTISQYAHICAGSHDFSHPDMPLARPSIRIGDDAWIAADAFVGPGVEVGEGALLGARGCAFKDLQPWSVYGGNPCKKVSVRTAKGLA
jgi:putative colanic acid biosynthesis acetyltransferase WcaF